MSEDRCGTYAGYQAHKRRSEDPCPPCRRANVDYIAQWRRDRVTSYRWEQSKQAARDRALRELARIHATEFRALYDAELAQLCDPFPHVNRSAS